MKNKKIIRNIFIVLTVLILILTIYIYGRMYTSFLEIKNSTNQYKNAGLLLSNVFQYGIFIYSIGLIAIVWIEYLVLNLIIRVYNKNVIITVFLTVLEILLTIVFIKVLIFIFMII